jgi:hypothetical protein
MLHDDIVGAVIAVHPGADLLSFWTKQGRTGSNDGYINDIAMSIARCLELPPGTRMKYRNHVDPGRDMSKPLFCFTVKGDKRRSGRGGWQ